MRRMRFWIKWDCQSAAKIPKMVVACAVSERKAILSFNFNCNFFQWHCIIVQSQKRCVIFSPKELQKEQDDLLESPIIQIKNISILYCNDLKYVFAVSFRGIVQMTLESNFFESNFFSKYIYDVGLLLHEEFIMQ